MNEWQFNEHPLNYGEHEKTATATLTASPTGARASTLSRAASAILSVTTSAARSLTLSRAATVSSAVSASAGRALAIARAATTAITSTPSGWAGQVYQRVSSLGVSVASSASRTLALARSLSGGVSLSSSASRTLALARSLSVAVSIALDSWKQKVVDVMATVGVSVGALSSKTATFIKSASTAITSAATSARKLTLYRTSSVGVAAGALFTKTRYMTAAVGVLVHSSSERASTILRSATAAVATSSTASRALELARSASASLSASLTGVRELDLSRTGTSIVGVLTSAARALVLFRAKRGEVSSTITCDTTTYHGWHCSHIDYNYTDDATYATLNYETSIPVGQKYTGGGVFTFYRYRGAVIFDLSSIPIGTVSAATMYLTGSTDNSTDSEFNATLYAYTSTDITNADQFDDCGATAMGSVSSTAYSTTAKGMEITLNSSGIAYINSCVGGNCEFMFKSDREGVGITENEWMEFCPSDDATANKRPQLGLTYTGAVPSAVSVSAAATKFATFLRTASAGIGAGVSTTIEKAVSAVASVGVAASATGSRTLELARSAAAGIAAAVSIGWTNGIYLLVRLGIYDYAHSRPAILRANVFVKAITTAYHKMIAKIFRGNI